MVKLYPSHYPFLYQLDSKLYGADQVQYTEQTADKITVYLGHGRRTFEHRSSVCVILATVTVRLSWSNFTAIVFSI